MIGQPYRALPARARLAPELARVGAALVTLTAWGLALSLLFG